MLSIKFIQIQNDISLFEKKDFKSFFFSPYLKLYLSSIALSFLLTSIHASKFYITLVTLVFLFLYYKGYKIYSERIKSNHIIGNVLFYENRMLSITNKKDIKLFYIDIEKFNIHYTDDNNGEIKKYLVNKELYLGIVKTDFYLKNGDFYTFKFLYKSEEELKQFIPILKTLYKSCEKVKEIHNDLHKTILFSYPDYEEIQKLKKELNVKTFYN